MSPDAETKVGCVIVGQSKEIILTSYNGFIQGANDSALPNTRPDKYLVMQHAEFNSVCQAARRGIALSGCSAVVTLSPCINCLRALWQVGIREIYFKDKYRDFDKQLNMPDLKISLTSVGIFTKITLSCG
jgi:dCMP deaminase